MAESNVATYNHDIVGIYSRINRFLKELHHSASAGVSQMIDPDYARLETYMANLKGYVAWVIAQPELDCPDTHPRKHMLQTPPELGDVENEEVNDIIRLLLIARDELTNSQSARLASRLIKYDHKRLSHIIEKVEQFMTTYVSTLTPLDLPESSPDEELSGPGETGI